MTLYTDRKPREAVARTIYEAFDTHGLCDVCALVNGSLFVDGEISAARLATAVLNLIRSNGWGSDLLLDAIHAEEDANGEPRSSVVPEERK